MPLDVNVQIEISVVIELWFYN